MTLVSEKWATAEEKVDVGEGGVPEVVDGSRRVSEEGPHETVQAMESDFVCSASVIVTVRGRTSNGERDTSSRILVLRRWLQKKCYATICL